MPAKAPDKIDLHNPYHELLEFFNAMDEVFFSYDFTKRKLIQISNACEKLFGHGSADFLGNDRLWFELVHPGDKPITIKEYKTLKLGERVNSQHRIIRKDNTIRWVEKKIGPILNGEGKLVQVNGVIRDITARKEDEEKHRKSEALYRRIVETAQEGIWMIDENDKTNFVNPAMCDMLGYAPAEMMGKELYDFMDKEGEAFARACIERRRKGIDENLDIRYVTKQGVDVWANVSANPIFDENGIYTGALAMITDITQRRIDVESLKKSTANLRTVFDNTDSAYILIDAEKKILSFNALAQKYSEKQNQKTLVAGTSMYEYFAPERWPVIQQVLDKVSAGEMVDYELNFADENRKAQWFNIRWLHVKNSNDFTWGFILVNKDITEAKIAALEREKITADLIQHNNDLEQFTYIVSHNLRAPVANILGLSDLLKEPDLEPEMRNEVVEKVSLSIKNIDTVIKDLNHILQARKPVNEKKEKVYFESLMSAIKTSVHNTIVNKNVQFNCSFDEVDSVFTIRSYMYSIFYNLTSNSIKYCQTDVTPVITIKSYKVDDKVELVFTDNGKGIDMDKNGDQLFGLYKRFDTTTEGKGMGLFMVKTQVEALGGTIKIKSKLGQGTQFILQFAL